MCHENRSANAVTICILTANSTFRTNTASTISLNSKICYDTEMAFFNSVLHMTSFVMNNKVFVIYGEVTLSLTPCSILFDMVALEKNLSNSKQ